MKLSEAIMLGQGLIEFTPSRFLEHGCGCLIGAGYAASTGKRNAFLKEIIDRWPWLDTQVEVPAKLRNQGHRKFETAEFVISTFAFFVKDGSATLEEVVDWIRSVEPAEDPSPSLPSSEFVAISPSIEAEVEK